MKFLRKILLVIGLAVAGTLIFAAGTLAAPKEKSAFEKSTGTQNSKSAGTQKEKSAGTKKSSVPAKASAKKSVADDDDVDDDFEDVEENLPGENYNAPWPTQTKLDDKQPAKTIQEGPTEWIYETRHFRFSANAPIAISTIKKIAWIFEGTYVANLALPLNASCNHYQTATQGKYKSKFYETYEQYLAGGGLPQSAGVYVRIGDPENGVTHVPFKSLGLEKRGSKYVRSGKSVDQTTLVHEITHHMTLHYFKTEPPLWFSEGYAEYVAASPYMNGKISFKNKKSVGAHLARRFLGEKNVAAPISLKQFMTQSSGNFLGKDVQFSYGMSLALFYYFCHCDGKGDAANLKAFIRALKEGKSVDDATQLLLAGRTWTKFQRDVASKLKGTGIRFSFPNAE